VGRGKAKKGGGGRMERGGVWRVSWGVVEREERLWGGSRGGGEAMPRGEELMRAEVGERVRLGGGRYGERGRRGGVEETAGGEEGVNGEVEVVMAGEVGLGGGGSRELGERKGGREEEREEWVEGWREGKGGG